MRIELAFAVEACFLTVVIVFFCTKRAWGYGFLIPSSIRSFSLLTLFVQFILCLDLELACVVKRWRFNLSLFCVYIALFMEVSCLFFRYVTRLLLLSWIRFNSETVLYRMDLS